MQRISLEKKRKMLWLRKRGHSIPEISRELLLGKTTVQRYVSGVVVPKKYSAVLREKQGGAKDRARGLRANTLTLAISEIGTLSARDRLLLLVGLYWGEGTKKDFGLINSDPQLIQTVICSCRSLGIPDNRLSLSLRIHREVSRVMAKEFWSKATGLPESAINRIEVIDGKKKGKLPYGMCRVRILSGIRERLFVQAAIEYIGKDSEKRVLSP